MSSHANMVFWDAAELYLRRWKRFDLSHQSRRRLFCVLLLISIIILYIAPTLLRWLWGGQTVVNDLDVDGITRELRPYQREADRFDSCISSTYDETGKNFLPYVANGKFGLPLNLDSPFYIQGKRALDLQLPFHPLVNVDSFGANHQTATVVQFVEGVVRRITSFNYMSQAAVISEAIYAHRLISPLLIQEVKISNPSHVPLILRLSRTGWKGKQPMKSEPLKWKSSGDVQYVMAQGELQSLQSPKAIGFAVLYPNIPDTIEIPAASKKTLIFRTLINYTEPMPIPELSSRRIQLSSTLREIAPKILDMMSTEVLKHHQDAWRSLWNSGFGISLSKAKGALNGDVINATIYYILSQKSTYSTEFDIIGMRDSAPELTKSLISRPDRCYGGSVPTLQASALWSSLDSFNDVQRIASLWFFTLDTNGCNNLVKSGAHGTMQAIMLSFMGLQFHQNHLEMGIHPKELHRDYYLRRVRYGNSSLINITVSVGDDNKASIYVAIDQNLNKRSYYGCDGGCLDPPVQLSSVERQFPVKITEPLTAILYITSDRQHIEELKHAIHVKEVAVAPAHENHVIALHRHGHQLGGLPIFFWVTILCLVVIFHVFLAKLIYNEYCTGGPSGNSRYAV